MLYYTISMFVINFLPVMLSFFFSYMVNVNSYQKHTLFVRVKSTSSDWLWQNNRVIVLWSLIAHVYLALENFHLYTHTEQMHETLSEILNNSGQISKSFQCLLQILERSLFLFVFKIVIADVFFYIKYFVFVFSLHEIKYYLCFTLGIL